MQREWIDARELVPKRIKKYDEDLLESDTIHFWPLKGCGELRPIVYEQGETKKSLSRAYMKGFNSVQ